MRLAGAAVFWVAAITAGPAAARNSACPEPRAKAITSMIAASHGDISIIASRVRERLSTQDVACWAEHGGKPMTLELAKRLETGDGIAKDTERAEQLYAAAAATKSGLVYIYTPAIPHNAGRVTPMRVGPDIPGLPEAAYRRALMHIEGRAAKPSPRRGFAMLRKLAKQGYPPAVARLAAMQRT